MRVNRQARGWLGFLGIPGGGTSPPEIAEFFQPHIDGFPFVAAESTALLSRSVTVAGPLGPGDVSVSTYRYGTAGAGAPLENGSFLVRSATVQVLLEAGDQARPRLTMSGLPISPNSTSTFTTGTVLVTGELFQAPADNETSVHYSCTYTFPIPFLLLPGMGFNFGYVEGEIATTVSYDLQLIGHELPAP